MHFVFSFSHPECRRCSAGGGMSRGGFVDLIVTAREILRSAGKAAPLRMTSITGRPKIQSAP